MSNQKSNSKEYPVPTEPPELVAKRDRLLAALDKQAKAATGTAQPVLRKMYDLLANTKVGAPLNVGLYQDVKNAFVRFMKDPVLPPPTIIMECVEFLQERLVAVGFTGQMEWPEGAPPLPAGFVGGLLEGVQLPTAPAAAGKPAGAKDGFESTGNKGKLTLNPETSAAPAPAPAAPADAKSEQQQLESFKTWMKNPGLGNVKG